MNMESFEEFDQYLPINGSLTSLQNQSTPCVNTNEEQQQSYSSCYGPDGVPTSDTAPTWTNSYRVSASACVQPCNNISRPEPYELTETPAVPQCQQGQTSPTIQAAPVSGNTHSGFPVNTSSDCKYRDAEQNSQVKLEQLHQPTQQYRCDPKYESYGVTPPRYPIEANHSSQYSGNSQNTFGPRGTALNMSQQPSYPYMNRQMFSQLPVVAAAVPGEQQWDRYTWRNRNMSKRLQLKMQWWSRKQLPNA